MLRIHATKTDVQVHLIRPPERASPQRKLAVLAQGWLLAQMGLFLGWQLHDCVAVLKTTQLHTQVLCIILKWSSSTQPSLKASVPIFPAGETVTEQLGTLRPPLAALQTSKQGEWKPGQAEFPWMLCVGKETTACAEDGILTDRRAWDSQSWWASFSAYTASF